MDDDQREQVHSNAKYLQQVRPIDPDEIAEYVTGQPHPAAVRQVLRESAADLGFLERSDGTFVPAPEGPVDVTPSAEVERLPERYGRVVENLLVEAYGPGWPDGDSGDELRTAIRRIKRQYHRGDAPTYDETVALGYAIYHLPAAYAAATAVLGDLAADGEVPSRVRVLDVGAGVGGQALATADLLAEDALVEYHAVEPSAAADVFEALATETGRNVHWTVHRETAEDFDPVARGPADGYDLVVFSNVLSELADPVAVVGRYLPALADDGTVVAIAPADRNTATGLRRVERAVEADHDATVYAPTVRLWPGRTPASDSWSFDVRPDLAVPAFQRRLDDGERAAGAGGAASENTAGGERTPGDGEFVNVDVQFAYSLLRRDDRPRLDYRADEGRVAPLAEMDDHVTDRIDCVGIKLSHDLSDDPDANPLYLVGDGSQQVDHFAVLTRPSALNDALQGAAYGDLLRFENVLVLWNDDEGAFNLVVDGETVVDRIPA